MENENETDTRPSQNESETYMKYHESVIKIMKYNECLERLIKSINLLCCFN